MAAHKTQIAIVGGGPGGYVAAFRAADLGLEVTLVDLDENPGGICLYRGCIPSKALLHVAKLLNEAKQASEWGVTFGEPVIDLDRLRAFKDSVVAKMTGGLGQLSKARKITYVRGRARFTGPHSLKIDLHGGGEQDLDFEQAILATGSRPVMLPAFDIGSERIMDSTGALELKDVPQRLLVVGGGIIGLELGQVYAALGSEVSVVEMLDGLIPSADRDLVRVLSKRLEAQFDGIHLNTKVTAVTESGGLSCAMTGRFTADASITVPASGVPVIRMTVISVAGKTPPVMLKVVKYWSLPGERWCAGRTVNRALLIGKKKK